MSLEKNAEREGLRSCLREAIQSKRYLGDPDQVITATAFFTQHPDEAEVVPGLPDVHKVPFGFAFNWTIPGNPAAGKFETLLLGYLMHSLRYPVAHLIGGWFEGRLYVTWVSIVSRHDDPEDDGIETFMYDPKDDRLEEIDKGMLAALWQAKDMPHPATYMAVLAHGIRGVVKA
jgi:hypothetical protein